MYSSEEKTKIIVMIEFVVYLEHCVFYHCDMFLDRGHDLPVLLVLILTSRIAWKFFKNLFHIKGLIFLFFKIQGVLK